MVWQLLDSSPKIPSDQSNKSHVTALLYVNHKTDWLILNQHTIFIMEAKQHASE